jgi:hypothetical protein
LRRTMPAPLAGFKSRLPDDKTVRAPPPKDARGAQAAKGGISGLSCSYALPARDGVTTMACCLSRPRS